MPAPIRRMWALLAVAFFAAAVASPAAAHTDLVSSNPEDGQTLTAPPEQVTLRFGEDLLTGGAQVVAKDDTGVKVGLGPAEVSGTRLSATWPQTADGGTYTVSWRAVADDGHPLEGDLLVRRESAAQPKRGIGVAGAADRVAEPRGRHR